MTAVRTTQSSRTDVNGQNVHASNTRADSLAIALKLGTKLFAVSFGAEKGSETRKLLTKAATRLNRQVEKVLIGILAGVKFQKHREDSILIFFLRNPKKLRLLG